MSRHTDLDALLARLDRMVEPFEEGSIADTIMWPVRAAAAAIRELRDDRDRARRIAVRLEQENAHLTEQLAAARNEIARLNGQTVALLSVPVADSREGVERIIRELLDTIPSRWLPQPTRTERHPVTQQTTAWFGGRGHVLATATRDGELEPDVHRAEGIAALLEGEAVARLDRTLIARRREDGDIGDGR